MLSKRSVYSLHQFLAIQNIGNINILLKKYELLSDWDNLERKVYPISEGNILNYLQSTFNDIPESKLHDLVAEFLRTSDAIRSQIKPKYQFDARWKDLKHCLQLDGYLVDGKELKTVIPLISESSAIEDDLSATIKKSNLTQKEAILSHIEQSAKDFSSIPPNYKGCLSNARVALEVLTRNIVIVRGFIPQNQGDPKWGQALQWLRQKNFISNKQEQGLSGVYTFISHGLHNTIGFGEADITRLGRELSMDMCYFLIKIHMVA